MKISAVPPVVNAMTIATQQSTDREMPSPEASPTNELMSIPDNNETTVEATQPLSPQLAEIAKRRRALQLRERAIAEKEKALQATNTGSSGGIDVARLKSDPLKVLDEAGVTYDQLTEALLATQGNAEINALKAEINALKEGVDKKFTDRETQAEQQVLAEMKREAERLSSLGEDFELVRETKSIPQVMTLIERTYRETGEVLDVSEALKLVEEELFKDLSRVTSFNKIKSQFAPPPAPQPQPKQQMGMRTLKNTDTAPVPLSRRAKALAAWSSHNK